jgi:hypothetical protein
VTANAEDWAPPIPDPLAWQARIDASGLHPNMRGSARFWKTVAVLHIVGVWARDGVPDFTEIVFELPYGIGLRLWTEPDSPFIRYGFCDLADSD